MIFTELTKLKEVIKPPELKKLAELTELTDLIDLSELAKLTELTNTLVIHSISRSLFCSSIFKTPSLPNRKS